MPVHLMRNFVKFKNICKLIWGRNEIFTIVITDGNTVISFVYVFFDILEYLLLNRSQIFLAFHYIFSLWVIYAVFCFAIVNGIIFHFLFLTCYYYYVRKLCLGILANSFIVAIK